MRHVAKNRGLHEIVSPLLGWRRSERSYAMVLVCYLDDAGTDPQNQFVSLAGFIGTVDAWAAFEEEAKTIMDRYGVSYIRGRDIYASDGDYSDQEVWTINHKIEFISALNEKLAPRVGLGMSFGTLKRQYKKRAEGRVRIQSPFGFSFEMLIHGLIEDPGFAKVVQMPKVDVSFVIEDGNANNAEIFQRYQRLKAAHSDKLSYFAGMAFADKNSTIAIQMADLFAFLARRHSEAIERNNRQQVQEHAYLSALRKNVRCIGIVSTDFGYSNQQEEQHQ